MTLQLSPESPPLQPWDEWLSGFLVFDVAAHSFGRDIARG
jgi:hypothetical protein